MQGRGAPGTAQPLAQSVADCHLRLKVLCSQPAAVSLKDTLLMPFCQNLTRLKGFSKYIWLGHTDDPSVMADAEKQPSNFRREMSSYLQVPGQH